jgi:hypothetical protein
MYVKTEYDGCPYITAGKVYNLFHVVGDEWDDNDLVVCADSGIDILVSYLDDIQGGLNPCPHLNDEGTWMLCDETGRVISKVNSLKDK